MNNILNFGLVLSLLFAVVASGFLSPDNVPVVKANVQRDCTQHGLANLNLGSNTICEAELNKIVIGALGTPLGLNLCSSDEGQCGDGQCFLGYLNLVAHDNSTKEKVCCNSDIINTQSSTRNVYNINTDFLRDDDAPCCIGTCCNSGDEKEETNCCGSCN